MSTLLSSLSDFDFIRRVTLTGANSYSFNSAQGMDLTQYQSFDFHLINVLPATDTAELWLRFSGATASYRYSGRFAGDDSSGLGFISGAAGSTKVLLLTNIGSVDSAEQGVSGKVTLIHPGNSTTFPHVEYKIWGANASTVNTMCNGFGRINVAQQITSLDFLPSTGSFESGIIDIYGRKIPTS